MIGKEVGEVEIITGGFEDFCLFGYHGFAFFCLNPNFSSKQTKVYLAFRMSKSVCAECGWGAAAEICIVKKGGGNVEDTIRKAWPL